MNVYDERTINEMRNELIAAGFRYKLAKIEGFHRHSWGIQKASFPVMVEEQSVRYAYSYMLEQRELECLRAFRDKVANTQISEVNMDEVVSEWQREAKSLSNPDSDV